MIRRIIRIDEEACNGCGACAAACHEGAIAMIGGKAKLLRDDYCDGMGDCLPECPAGAITFEEREAAAYDEKAVAEHKTYREAEKSGSGRGQSGCPGMQIRQMHPAEPESPTAGGSREAAKCADGGQRAVSQLRNWPVQIKLAPLEADYFDGASLLVAADCTAYAYGAFHQEFMWGRVTLIGCPKLDGVDYSAKLAEIFRRNEIQDVTMLRMQVPCCGGLEAAVRRAIKAAGSPMPLQVVTVSVDGTIVGRQ